MINLQHVDPVDFAGGVGHMVAGNIYLLVGEAAGLANLQASAWYGGAEDADIVADITALARYVVQWGAEGGRLFAWANIEGVMTRPRDPHEDIAREAAYNLFASVTSIAHEQLAALGRASAEASVVLAPPPPVPIADTIFEPVGSIGDMEPHQAEFMRLQAEAASRPVVETVADEPDGVSAGTHEDSDEPRPEAISAGMKEDGHAQTDDAAGQGEGIAAAADPQAQGSVSGLSDAGDAGAPSPAGDEPVEAVAGEGSFELGAPLAEPQGAASEALDPVTAGTVVTDKPRRKTSK